MFEMNFYSRRLDEIKRRRRNFLRSAFFIFCIGLVCVLGAGLYLNESLDLQTQIDQMRLARDSASLELAVAEAENTEAELNELRSLNADLLARAADFENGDIITTDLFIHLLDALPRDLYLQSIDANTVRLNAAGMSVSKEVIAACEYNLKQMKEFSDVFVQIHSNNSGAEESYNFSITAIFANAEESTEEIEPADDGGSEELSAPAVQIPDAVEDLAEQTLDGLEAQNAE